MHTENFHISVIRNKLTTHMCAIAANIVMTVLSKKNVPGRKSTVFEYNLRYRDGNISCTTPITIEEKEFSFPETEMI